MIDEDKKLIAEYMGWKLPCNGNYNHAVICAEDGDLCVECELYHPYNPNDASLCVAEMQKRGEWQKFCATGFVIYFEGERPSHVFPENYIAWLFNADNFFGAMAAWRREEKKC